MCIQFNYPKAVNCRNDNKAQVPNLIFYLFSVTKSVSVDIFSGKLSPDKIRRSFYYLWKHSKQTDSSVVAKSEMHLNRLLSHFSRTNFPAGENMPPKLFRAQCWECLNIVCATKPCGGFPKINPPCHPISCCKDRERSYVGRFVVKGAFIVQTTTVSSLFSLMADSEQNFVLHLMEKSDILMVRNLGTSRSYLGRTKNKYQVCEIEDMEVFIVSTAAVLLKRFGNKWKLFCLIRLIFSSEGILRKCWHQGP